MVILIGGTMFDLHIHSTYSDGKLDPESIIINLKEQKIQGFSITDHDCIAGLEEAATISKMCNIKFIPGIEFGVSYNGREIHILGYFIDYKNEKLNDFVIKLQENRKVRISNTLIRLNELGVKINESSLNIYKGSDFISRSHIAMYLVDNNYVKSINEAFEKYLGESGSAYIEKNEVELKDVLDIIKISSGVSILAHPFKMKEKEIIDIINSGIDGIEVINSKHSRDTIINLMKIVDKYNLIPTAGSDCHGRLYDENYLMGKFLSPNSSIKRLESLHNLRK